MQLILPCLSQIKTDYLDVIITSCYIFPWNSSRPHHCWVYLASTSLWYPFLQEMNWNLLCVLYRRDWQCGAASCVIMLFVAPPAPGRAASAGPSRNQEIWKNVKYFETKNRVWIKVLIWNTVKQIQGKAVARGQEHLLYEDRLRTGPI